MPLQDLIQEAAANIDINEVAENLGIDATRWGLLTFFRPYTSILKVDFRILSTEGSGGYGLSGMSIYLYTNVPCTIKGVYGGWDKSKLWGPFELQAHELWSKGYTTKRIPSFCVECDGGRNSTYDLVVSERLDKLSETEAMEVWRLEERHHWRHPAKQRSRL